jgi:thioredoxin-related protein
MFLRVLLSAAVLMLAGLSGTTLAAADVRVAEISNLQSEARLSEEKNVPILLMFAADHCPYCGVVEEDFLKPMIISGDYVDKALIRKLDLDTQGDVIDFAGNKIGSGELAKRYAIDVTPTVVFLDSNGRQLARRMVGLSTPDYYGYYLDEAIDKALDKLRKRESAD